MIRARFRVCTPDPRPVRWPIKHPYWITGEGDDYFILVAYADDGEEIMANWPEANDIDAVEVQDYVFTDRFQKPDWFMPGAVQYTSAKPQETR